MIYEKEAIVGNADDAEPSIWKLKEDYIELLAMFYITERIFHPSAM